MFPVEAFQTSLGKVTAILRQLGVRFHLTGGITSVLYGEPRLTQDIDIVVENEVLARQAETFCILLGESDFLFDPQSVRTALENRSMFQLFDNKEALKFDVYPRELIRGELERSCQIEVFPGVRLPVVSQADAAASKLIWVSKGSHKSRRDLRQIYRTANECDRKRIGELAQQLDLESLLNEVLEEPDEIG